MGLLVLVTGANRGLGYDVSMQLASSGHRVLMACRNTEEGKKAENVIKKETGNKGEVGVLEVDTGGEVSVRELVNTVKCNYDQQIDILINNAAIYQPAYDPNTYDVTMATNVNGPILLAQSLLPYLAGGGRIVNVSSEMGQLRSLSNAYKERIRNAKTIQELLLIGYEPRDTDMASQYYPCYRISKAMINRATQLLAQDPMVKSRRLTVSCVDPGWCRTDMGGPSAPRSSHQGRDSVLWNALHVPAEDTQGGFFRDGRPLAF
eukprot:comp22007_c0_seq1/m.31856 comp22007_c0_seq1/g.31856  ORF comp22007_c0_seq1/g.31856 comp22007_c0_seq1/m.31856 type:complete len:262 (-) comp22007_c0_seq1:3-788(-)